MAEETAPDPVYDPTALPRHVAIIMDGNGRWAEGQGLERTAGHAAGEAAMFDVIEGAVDIGIEWLTLFTFSTENWARSAEEVLFLMEFNEALLLRRRDHIHEWGCRARFVGVKEDPRIPDRNKMRMVETEEMTKDNDTMNLVFAFVYGGRAEIVAAARSLARSAAEGTLDPDDVDEAAFASRLYLPDMPDADLVIRTSGEHRLSNFLLWQSAYAELVISDLLWPDFGRDDLARCIGEYQRRGRRFGTVVE